MTSTATRTPSGAASALISSRLLAAARWLFSAPGGVVASAYPRCTTMKPAGTRRATSRAAAVSPTARARSASSGGERQRPDPRAVDVPLDDGRVDRVERERVLTQPPDELVDRRSVVVVEVAPRGEQLDAVESALGELAQVAPAQPLVVIQVRGDAEPHVRATPFLEAGGRFILSQLLDVLGEQLAQHAEARVAREIRTDVADGARHVLDVDRVLAGRGLIAERPERLQVALQRHQVESPPEVPLVRRDPGRIGVRTVAALEREK
jgi:hypothetical protein